MKKSQIKVAAAEAAATAKNLGAIAQPKIAALYLEAEGTAPLIMQCFSQKAVEEMLRAHMGLARQREKKVPRQLLEDALILNTDNVICVPPTGLKKAMCIAATGVKGLTKAKLQIHLYIEGGSVPITYSQKINRMDWVRNSGVNRAPDVRFRPMFVDWKIRFGVQYPEHILSVQTVVDIAQRAGRVGLLEYRPGKSGSFGTFRLTRALTDEAEINEVSQICTPQIKPLVIPDWALDMEIDPKTLSKIMSGALDDDDGESEGQPTEHPTTTNNGESQQLKQ